MLKYPLNELGKVCESCLTFKLCIIHQIYWYPSPFHICQRLLLSLRVILSFYFLLHVEEHPLWYCFYYTIAWGDKSKDWTKAVDHIMKLYKKYCQVAFLLLIVIIPNNYKRTKTQVMKLSDILLSPRYNPSIHSHHILSNTLKNDKWFHDHFTMTII